MVGRGVRAQRPVDALEVSVDTTTDPTAVVPAAPGPALTSPVSANAPVAAQETLTYPNRLEGHEPAEEALQPSAATLKPEPFTAKTAPANRSVPAPSLPLEPRNAKPGNPPPQTSDVPGEPAGNGFVVQVAAVNDRREADTIARRLAGKGYPSFVTTPPNGVPKMFRVRIGKYPTRREAETIAARLEKEDQFKPWITR